MVSIWIVHSWDVKIMFLFLSPTPAPASHNLVVLYFPLWWPPLTLHAKLFGLIIKCPRSRQSVTLDYLRSKWQLLRRCFLPLLRIFMMSSWVQVSSGMWFRRTWTRLHMNLFSPVMLLLSFLSLPPFLPPSFFFLPFLPSSSLSSSLPPNL